MTLTFERQEPLVDSGGDQAEYQVGESFTARWTARLSDGTWAVVTQAFYMADFEGRRFVESQVEYLCCADPNEPGGSEINANTEYIDHTDDISDDPRVLAEHAVQTTAAEWARFCPSGAPEQ